MAELMEEYDHIPSASVQRNSSRSRWHTMTSSTSFSVSQQPCATPVEKFSVPHYFKFRLFPGKYIKIAFDRLILLALMDRYSMRLMDSIRLMDRGNLPLDA